MFNFRSSANPILTSIEKIYAITKDSCLKETALQAGRSEIAVLSAFWQVTEEQAVLLSILIHSQLENRQVSTKEILDHTNLGLSVAVYLTDVLKPLVDKEWLAPKKNNRNLPLADYSIQSKLLASALTGTLQESSTAEAIENSFQLVAKFHAKLGERNSRRMTYTDFIAWTWDFLQENSSVELADFILKMNMPREEGILFLYICSRFYMGDDSVEPDDYIRDLLPPKEKQYELRRSFASGNHSLLQAGLIREGTSGDFFRGTVYVLTEKGLAAFDKEAVINNKAKETMFQHMEPGTIPEKELIFESHERKMVNKLHDMLSHDNYALLTEKLKNHGMKKGISILLHGHPGTGKTETVLQLGRKSKRFIMMADSSKIRSKWVGETEKNMKALFNEYRKALKECKETPILLFNEADAILGKRHVVTDRGDQMENAMQNILLQELEDFEGIFIATTNLADNLDKAFDRRFLYKIKFDRPGTQTLMQIWKSKFPKLRNHVLRDVCAQYHLTGGQIENIRKKVVVDSLLDDNLKITAKYLLQMAQQELSLEKKNERNSIGFAR